jgi:hypothetical protein
MRVMTDPYHCDTPGRSGGRLHMIQPGVVNDESGAVTTAARLIGAIERLKLLRKAASRV